MSTTLALPPTPVIHGRVLRSPEDLESLVPEWRSFMQQVPDATPFQSPDWLIPWWRHCGSGRLFTIAFRAEERLVGLVPMFIHEWEGRRQVTLLGSGLSDYVGPIAERAYMRECLQRTFEMLCDTRDQWDLCSWQDLQHALPVPESVARCLHLEGPGTMQVNLTREYRDRLSSNLRSNVRQQKRRLAACGSFTLRSERVCRPETIDTLLRLHNDRWAREGGPSSMLDVPRNRHFLVAMGRAFSAAGNVRIYTASLEGEIVAMILALTGAATSYGYLTGFEPALRKYSIGSVLLDYAMETAVAEGARTWDFLRGEEAYKRRWGGEPSPQYRLTLTPADLPERLTPQVEHLSAPYRNRRALPVFGAASPAATRRETPSRWAGRPCVSA